MSSASNEYTTTVTTSRSRPAGSAVKTLTTCHSQAKNAFTHARIYKIAFASVRFRKSQSSYKIVMPNAAVQDHSLVTKIPMKDSN
ncbi:hypothetical protein FOBRF1_002166 [Fusarium oxysporum]